MEVILALPTRPRLLGGEGGHTVSAGLPVRLLLLLWRPVETADLATMCRGQLL